MPDEFEQNRKRAYHEFHDAVNHPDANYDAEYSRKM